jgi:MATE family multidrug resistance protein
MLAETPGTVVVEATALGEARRLARLAWPVVLAYLGTVSMGTVDTVMAGHLSARALAGVALGNAWTVAVAIVALSSSRALDPIVAQAHGAGDRVAAGRGLTRGLVMGWIFTVPTAAALAAAAPGLALIGQPAELVPDASLYCRVRILGLPALMTFMMMRQFLQGLGIMRPGTVAVLLANVVNAFLNWILMFGNLGAPRLGVAGCAAATAAAEWTEMLLLAWLARDRLRAYWPGWAGALDLEPLRRLFRLGIPLGFQFGLEVWAFLTAGFLMGRLGPESLAAHAVAINLSTISFMLPNGLGAAAATRVGHLEGAGLPWRRSAWVAVGLGAAVMVPSALLFAARPSLLAGLYTADPKVLAVASALLPLAAVFQLFDGVQAVSFGALRGLGDVIVPALVNAIGYWLVGLPVGAWLAFGVGLGPTGVWTGLVVGLAVVAGLLGVRLLALTRSARARTSNKG